MKYVLVNKFDEIVDTVDIAGGVGISGATTYFQGMKKLPDQRDFHKSWKVMTKDEYNTNFKNNLQNRQLGKRKYEWWKDDESYLDIDK